jgi:hypothetical protein
MKKMRPAFAGGAFPMPCSMASKNALRRSFCKRSTVD